MNILKAIRSWWQLFITEPTEIGVEGRQLRPHEEGYVPVTAAPGRMMFPAQAWSVPKDGPNEPGPSRAEQLYPQLVPYEWDVLLEAAGRTPSSPIITGAAYNACAEFLAKSGATGLMGKPTELGLELLRMRDERTRIDVV